eukprot:scaffold292880_cov33-Tisochrysis_lutea.AAC.1
MFDRPSNGATVMGAPFGKNILKVESLEQALRAVRHSSSHNGLHGHGVALRAAMTRRVHAVCRKGGMDTGLCLDN